MNGASRKIFLDTNALRYLGKAFNDTSLDDEVRNSLLMSPISAMELVSQLATQGADEALAAIQAITHIHNPKRTGLLPWSDEAFRMAIFGLPPRSDGLTETISNAINTCLSAATAAELYDDSLELRKLLNQAKAEATENFSALLESRRLEGPLADELHRGIFARSIAKRAGVSQDAVDIGITVDRLNALYTYEVNKLENAASAREYNVAKHANDVFDAEQLIHLADPTLHLVTSDTGFNLARESSQSSQIHVVPVASMSDAGEAAEVLRAILVTNG